jgi:hypothetical protein
MSLELVVGDDAACRGGVELLYYGQVRWMLHVLPKTGNIVEPSEDSVGVSSGTPEKSLPTDRSTVLGTSSHKARIDERRSSTSSGEASSLTARNTRWSTTARPP